MKVISNEKSGWRLRGCNATLDRADVVGAMDLHAPQLGLQIQQVAGQPYRASLLGVMAEAEPTPLTPLSEYFVRGNELVAVYGPAPRRPFTIRVCWQLLAGEDDGVAAFQLGMHLSLHTNEWACDPVVNTASSVPAAAHYARLAALSGEIEAIDAASPTWQSSRETVCHVAMDAAGDTTFCEMIRPSDLTKTRYRQSTDGLLQLQWSVLGPPEKGVIRRAQFSAAIMRPNRHSADAESLFRAFAASDVPLTA